jgi:hypothetical protein
LALFLCAGQLLAAQNFADITLYFAPVAGGAPEEREFFDAHLHREITGAHYRVVHSREEADFLVTPLIITHEDSARPSCLVLGVITAANNSLLLELFWDYVDVKEMFAWDLGGILAPETSGERTARASRPGPGDDAGAPDLALQRRERR